MMAIVVAKTTSWQRYIDVREGEEADAHVLSLVQREDPSIAKMLPAHESHTATVNEVEAALTKNGIDIVRLEDPYAPFSTEGASLVVTVGGDGTLLSASHHVAGIPILGINSAPSSSVGFFCGVHPGEVEASIARFVRGELRGVRLSRMEVVCNDDVIARRVLNDALFCHPVPAATSRYLLDIHGTIEEQTSSGLWIGPAAGSTAAQRSAGGDVLPLESRQIQVVVREPYTPHGHPLTLRCERIEPGEVTKVRCKMREAKLYLDGPHQVHDVILGDLLEFRESREPLTLLEISSDRCRSNVASISE